MTRILPSGINRFEAIHPAWRSAVFGGCDGFHSRQYPDARRQFAAMKHSFRSHGGFLSTDDVALRMRCCYEQPISRLAHWIVSRSIVCICWEAQTLIPVFQFSLADMSIRKCCQDVLHELRDVLDNWEVARWFAAPNVRLDYAAPVSILTHETSAVLQAARWDRALCLS